MLWLAQALPLFQVVEYFMAYCGALAMQSHPINWVSSHRHHHGATVLRQQLTMQKENAVEKNM